ncbi:unnamed protein product [Rotaria socialis]|uniref:G8 domain-containing protein n=1 Tax=Rotaria socialis TaxID=392032 RepID=A0A821HTS6_9BILA|nr:unnamed protein product [Rotaria socialis]CAF4553533.1 unnamed protein product [Rotaria socialis]CAF4693663.1 unnamed protein product [Rotaria socialis]
MAQWFWRWCSFTDVRYWSNDSHWTFGPQDYNNWNGTKPGNDQNIFVPRCIWLVIDDSLPTIRSLRIDGVVEFQQGRSHTMYVDNIIINGGRLIAGLPESPFNGSVDIILQDRYPVTITLPYSFPLSESRTIAVLGGLDLHGSSRNVSWTRIAISAESGDNLIILRESVNWVVGDEIIITTTDRAISHTERHRIASIENGTMIRTVAPLAYTHIVLQQPFSNGQMIDIAAAVGLLTRNVRVINQNSSRNLFGFRIVVTQYWTNVWDSSASTYVYTYYKGYARLSNTQFIGFGRFDETDNSDQQSGIYMNSLGDWNYQRPTYIDSCSFDGGFNAAIGMFTTNGVPITNNIIYNTYRSGIAITGKNNIVQNNLVTTIYWSGSAQPTSIAQYNMNNDGAIMSRNAVSVIMQNNLVSGVERLAYRIQGEACPGTYTPYNIYNSYSNNEAHSAMSGVNLWPLDKGFVYSRKCVIIRGFTTYKTWYYGFYINTPRNITIDSCKTIDSQVGIFTYVIGPSPLTHISLGSRINIVNSIVIGSITPNDCNDTIDSSTNNFRFSQMAIPTVSTRLTNGKSGGRSGIVFPTISTYNGMPIRSWNGIGNYPSLDGALLIRGVTLAFFNDTCDRHDVAIQVSQSNDDGQFPITTSSMLVYNTPADNIILNGQPNLGVVNPNQCGDMDCDGLKKDLVTDTDGTLFGQQSSVFSQAESLWGNQQHGVGDFRIPMVAMTNLSGQRINISSIYPYRGISRSNSCVLHSSWGMYQCINNNYYSMLIIESMDSDTETRRLSPIAIMSSNGYIDLINGPQNHAFCNGYGCRRRISTFMAIVESGQTYQIYLTSTPPRSMRFRLINVDSTIRCILALYYNSLQQIDVYANTAYVSPTNRDPNSTVLKLLEQPNSVTLSSTPGANYFDSRTHTLAYFLINGNTTIDVKVSPLLILNFGLPAIDPATFYNGDLVAKLAAVFNISPDKIRHVNITSASNPNRGRRQTSSIKLNIELRDEPRASSVSSAGVLGEVLSNIGSSIINRYQTGQLQIAWKYFNVTGDVIPENLYVQEPFDLSSTPLGIINRTVLLIAPANCREQSPCTTQPILVAYDSAGNIIQKLGSNDHPWQVQATVIGQSSQVLYGAIANYSNGQVQFNSFSLPGIGTYQIKFTFISPMDVNSSFFLSTNLTVQTNNIVVTEAILAGQQVNNIYVVNASDTFDISVMPIDNITGLELGQIQWSNWTWSANVTLYNLPNFNSHGSLRAQSTSRTIIDVATGTVTVTNLTIDATGMYILNITLVSSDNKHFIQVASNAILVKNSTDTLIVDWDQLLSNVTFSGDFDAINASNQLEIKRAMIYNFFIFCGMPLISDITLLNGSVVAVFQPDALPTNISAAVAKILKNANAVSDLTVKSVSVNGQSYSVSSASSGNGESSSWSINSPTLGRNIGLIVGLVVGLGGGLLLTIGIVWLRHKHKQMNAHRRLADEPMNNKILTSDDQQKTQSSNVEAHTIQLEMETNVLCPERIPSPSVNRIGSGRHNENVQSQPLATNTNDMELIAFD